MYLVANWISIGWEKDEEMNVPGNKMNIYWIRKGWRNECTWLQNEYLLDEKRINKCMYLVAKWISNGWEKMNKWMCLVTNWISIGWEKD